MKIDKATAGYVVLALAVLIAGALGVYALTPVAQRPELLHALSGPFGQFAALAIAAAGAWVTAYKARATHAETQAQTPVLEQIQHQTNGNLDKRLADNRQATVEAIRADLRAAGILPGAASSSDAELAPVEPLESVG